MARRAVVVADLWKRFRIYQERNEYLKVSVLRGRRARYEEFWAVKGVTFDVAAGAAFGIVGQNGSGKSTLLKCMARILRPERGSVALDGRAAALLELGAGFHPELSGRENVFLNASILGMPRREVAKRFDDIVGFAGLERFVDMPVKNYSSGMYVRLGFAVAINVDPEILLIDEVLAVGDASFQRRCLDRINELRRDGRTIVLVSHDLDSVRAVCDRAAWLEYGVLREVGPVSEVLAAYTGTVGADVGGAELARLGSGELQVTGVELLDPRGRPTRAGTSGERLTLRIRYTAHVPVPKPVFGFIVVTDDDVVVCSTNTRVTGDVPDVVSGDGVAEAVIDPLPLLPGTYWMGFSVRDFSLGHVYDYRQRFVQLVVTGASDTDGIVDLAPRWDLPDPGPAGA